MGSNSYVRRPSGPSSYLNVYTPTFARHLHHLAVSDFYARELDADDHEFLEYVKCRGIANGTLPCTNTVLLEELEYWHLPYAVDWTIKRTHGPVPMRGKGETAESRAVRIAAWKARNAERLANKAISDAEMEREQAEYDAARARRKWREINIDAEWEAADPNRKAKSASGSVSGKGGRRKLIRFAGSDNRNSRYYVPQWKIDEQNAKKAERDIWAVAVRVERDAKRAERRAAAATARVERAMAAGQDAEAQLAAIKAERAARLKASLERIERRNEGHDPVEVEATKKAIASMIRMTFPAVWTPERLTQVLGLAPEKLDLVVFCAEAMVRDGQLRTARTKTPA